MTARKSGAFMLGSCDVAIGNTYYMGKMQTNSKKPNKKTGRAARIIFPDAKAAVRMSMYRAW